MIIIDQISSIGGGAVTSLSVPLTITSQDAVALCLIQFSSNAALTRVTFNGTPMTQLAHSTNGTNNVDCYAYIMLNPPVGSYTMTVVVPNTNGMDILGLSLLGVNKKSQTPTSNAVVGNSVTTLTIPITVPTANSLIISQVQNIVGGGTSTEDGINFFSSYKYSAPGAQTMTWTKGSTDTWSGYAIVLEPDDAPSPWFPNVGIRNKRDTVTINEGNTNTNAIPTGLGVYGNHPVELWKNSFLHTVGRILSFPVIASSAAEIEQQTSQIIIDKVFQGQVAGNGISAGVLNLDVNIPSQEAVLVVTGGSVIATGAPFASVTLNGDSLQKLVQTSVAGIDSEIWIMWNPPVGTYTLTITGGNTTAQVYANAMVLLGVDKMNTNVLTASATDAATLSTITANITPDAPNSLLIDSLATLDATAAPVPDQSQTPVFNVPGINTGEAVLSTFKIVTTSQNNMNYNLSVTVNAALTVIALRPAHAASLWFPNIDFRHLDDTVTTNGLDAGINASFGNYGYYPSEFYRNSFVHTLGRLLQNQSAVFTWQQLIASGQEMPREHFDKVEVIDY